MMGVSHAVTHRLSKIPDYAVYASAVTVWHYQRLQLRATHLSHQLADFRNVILLAYLLS